MKCISLWQPWATLWVNGFKIHETRHWPFPKGLLGETIYVHAAKRNHSDERKLCEEHELFASVLAHLGHSYETLPRGAIVGSIVLVECLKTEDVYLHDWDGYEQEDFYFGNYEPGRFAWKATNPICFKSPIPVTGRQGFFEVLLTSLEAFQLSP